MTVQDHPGPVPGRSTAGHAGQSTGIPGPPGTSALPVVDEARLAAFYRAEIDGLLTYLTRRIGRDDAGELAGQIFEEFCAWWPNTPGHPKPERTLYRIAQCRLNDRFRRRGRTLTLETSDLEYLADSVREEGFAAVELRIDFEQALAELDERQRQALLLHHVAGFAVKECAEVLGVGIDNMKKILKQARGRLRQSPRMDAYETTATAKEVHR
ncbi:RNA polymerase sigma factor [Wenjunlia tyrosinilytica]|uniref:RNA polymerase sigma factor 70 region 4 type 2 domain-containing protein n=1 Tax=Wenjunlia tyrosinilytica TaxID=1544741 RepID=A0A917ZYW4_9ACTN|nr:RNA polymerase sigma factor [Wenjunlia tyrosinilytica]GGP00335.1 hypothetical protein GCM10012280_68870 [Wenjunlia tyrosinilytica]